MLAVLEQTQCAATPLQLLLDDAETHDGCGQTGRRTREDWIRGTGEETEGARMGEREGEGEKGVKRPEPHGRKGVREVREVRGKGVLEKAVVASLKSSNREA